MRLRPSLTALAVAAVIASAAPAPLAAADTTPPVAAPPRAAPQVGATVGTLTPFSVAWHAATDGHGSGVAAYQLRVRVDGGSWQSIRLPSPTARSTVVDVRPGHDYQLEVRAVDRAGNAGGWAVGAPFRHARLAETTPALGMSAGWSLRTAAEYVGGRAFRSGRAGATATLSFTGRQVAWIAPRGPTRGTARVSIDGVAVSTVDLHRASLEPRRIVFRRSWSTPGAHVLGIRVSGTSGHPYVDLDGFVVVDDPPPDPVLVGAGDVSYCSSTGDEKTAALLDGIAGTVFVAGDLAYPGGTATQFATCYGPTWGRWKARTRPVPGNHEYRSPGAAPYFAYFGARAGPAGKGWYAYDLGTWRIYGLNSNCDEVGGCGPGSEQERWLRADLAAHPHACVAAVWHHPRFSSGDHGDQPQVAGLWAALEDAGAELVLNGHDHDYERFAPQTGAGVPSPAGIRELVVGTGGASLRPFVAVHATSEARSATTLGVLELTLRPGSYAWRFVPVAGASFTDAGSGTCH